MAEPGPILSGNEIRTGLFELADLAHAVAESESEAIAAYGALVLETLRAGGKLMFCGNGGSAADAQHLAAEYVVQLRRRRAPLPAIALTTDTSVLTACANDRGFEDVFARQVEALGRPGDLLVLHSTSGRSPNLLRAAEAALDGDIRAVGLLARGGGPLKALVDVAVVVPTERVSRAQEVHLALGHLVCHFVEESLFADAAET